MKPVIKIGSVKAYVILGFVLASIIVLSCKKTDNTVLVKPAVAIKPAENVTRTTATIVANVVPNTDGTSVSFEYNSSENSTWVAKTLPLTFKGKDSVKVTFDLSDLKVGTDYSFRVKATNAVEQLPAMKVSFQLMQSPIMMEIFITL